MNWNKIKESCPKSFELATTWYYQSRGVLIDDCNIEREFNFRDLYDFFDEHEIFVSIELTINETGIVNEAIYTPYLDSELISGDFDTKKESEIVAFTEAFEALENRL